MQETKKLKNSAFLLKRFLSSHIATNYAAALDYKLIPRPSIIRYLRDFMPGGEFKNATFHEFAVGMRKRLGDIFVIPGVWGRSDMVMVFNTKDIECVYRNEGQWPKRKIFDSLQHFREKTKGDFFNESVGLIAAHGEQWGKMRSAVNPLLMKAENLTMYIKPLQEINDEFIKRIKKIRDPVTLEVPDNFAVELNRMSFESLSLIALNRKLDLVSQTGNNHDAERLIQCTRLNLEFIHKLDMQPSIWKYIGTPTYYKNLKVQEDIFRLTQKYIKESVKQIKETQKRAGENNIGFKSILENLMITNEKMAEVATIDLIFAGVDATMVTLIAILLCLAKNPEKQQILREEILKIMPTKDTQLNEINMKSLPYLRAVIKEGIRYYPSSPGAIRSSAQNIVLSGYKVPQGSNVLMCFNCLLRDEAFFPQADKFLPERWLRDENNMKAKLDPFSYLPFGVGSRICVGKRLAELKLEMILLKFLRHFEIEFNYDASKPFKPSFVNLPGIPMRFKFKDLEY